MLNHETKHKLGNVRTGYEFYRVLQNITIDLH